MDFSNFVITGPSTLTASIFYNLRGSIVIDSAQKIGQVASLATNCLTDTFTVTGSGGTSPPVICGTNTGYHSRFYSNVNKITLKKFRADCDGKSLKSREHIMIYLT